MDENCPGVSVQVAVPGVLHFACPIKGLTAGYVNCPAIPAGEFASKKLPPAGPRAGLTGRG